MVENGTGLRTAVTAAILAATLALAGCGDDSPRTATTDAGTEATTGTSATESSPTTSARALSVSGTPATTATAGAPWSFVPALDSGATATFSIANKPAWASFNIATGELSGTPTARDVGSFAGIVISASTATGSASLPAFTLTVQAAADASAASSAARTASTTGAATLSWTPPTSHTDGSSVTNLAGYNIYYGSSAESLGNKIRITNPGLTAYTVSNLGAGTHFFGISAYTTAGTESDMALVGSKTIM